MYEKAYDSYLESRVLSADPVELVEILYSAALEAIGKARRHLAEGDIAARSRQVTRALEIVGELNVSLDLERGGEVAANLASLYDYIQRTLLRANLEQSDAPLAESARLLSTLLEGWQGARQPKPQVEETPVVQYAEAGAGQAQRSWSY